METPEELLEPLKYYEYDLKNRHQENVEAFFDDLLAKSGIDPEENRATCKQYYSETSTANQFDKKLSGGKSLRGFFIFLTILCFVAGTVLIALPLLKVVSYPYIFIPIGVFLILGGIFTIIMNSTLLAKKIERLSKIVSEHRAKAEKLKIEAQNQLVPLNRLYDWNIPSRLFTKTAPIIKMDDNCTCKTLNYMIYNYGLPVHADNVSSIFVQSGTIIGNPFLFERRFSQYMYQKVYTGSITIHWTTTSTDSKGNTVVHHHSQTLTAQVTQPASGYSLDTRLIYCNEAAPKLSFSRAPSGANHMNEKEIEKHIAKFEKKLAKMQQDKINSNFTPLGNTKFEALFNALNRDSEVEFRLLFTPLAQKNEISLITSKVPYGDDFSFSKKGMINIIHSSHAQSLKFDGNPYHFYDFDIDRAKDNFVSYNMKYFQGIYYDFAPLLSIPLYQQHKDYDPKVGNVKNNTSLYEAEVLCNFMDPQVFKPEDCDTEIILKATPVATSKNVDIFNIHSYGYQMIPHVTLVPKMGGDGYWHDVPVHWFEYIEVQKDTPVAVVTVGGTKQDYIANKDSIFQFISTYSMSSDIIYQRGLLSFPLKEGISFIDENEIIKMFSHKED